MPTITRKEFAELCGDDEKKLNVYISRGKVSTLPNNKKLIDTTNPVNSAFINDRQTANQLKSAGLPVPKPIKKSHVNLPNKKKVELPQSPAEQKRPSGKNERVSKIVATQKAVKESTLPKSIQQQVAIQTARDMKRVDQEMQKKEKELNLIDLRIQREQLLLNKSAGQLLPIDLVRGVVTRNASSIFKSFENGCVNIASIFSAGDQKVYARVLGELKVELSKCVQDAGRMAEEEVEILVTEFSQTLLRGQKKV